MGSFPWVSRMHFLFLFLSCWLTKLFSLHLPFWMEQASHCLGLPGRFRPSARLAWGRLTVRPEEIGKRQKEGLVLLPVFLLFHFVTPAVALSLSSASWLKSSFSYSLPELVVVCPIRGLVPSSRAGPLPQTSNPPTPAPWGHSPGRWGTGTSPAVPLLSAP